MLTKLSPLQQILILAGILLVGAVLGNILPPVKTWFKPSDGGEGTGRYGCPTRGGEECCRPARWRFNNESQQYECIGAGSQ